MAAVAPMDLVVKSEQPTSIPLRCTICPKKPSFSDLSHLLTHISSKSHLAHRFKVELKSRTDPNALQEVRQYEVWCERYGINALLAERMAAKEQKKTGRRGRSSQTANNRLDVTADHHTTLTQASIKAEAEDYSNLTSTTVPWSTAPAQYHGGREEYFDDSSYHIPNLKRSRSDRSVPSTPDRVTQSKYRWPSETETTDSVTVSELPSEGTDILGDENDSNKLKGTRYPGMGLFDSADEIQRRMRNQRKADSVLKQMEEASSGFEPTEFVWSEDGEFQRIRDIYATPSIEGSPDRIFEERDGHKQKRVRRSTAATAPTPGQGRQTRASTRIARQMASRNRRDDEDDDDFEQDDDETSKVSGHSHGPAESYDIYRDPPKPSPARTESSLGESGFELRRRPALQPLNSNLSLVPPAPKSVKSLPYFPARDAASASFTSQSRVPNTHYFQQQHTMGAGTFNPLCLQNRGGYYHSYGYQGLGNGAKPSTGNFEAISTLNLGSMPFNTFAGSYAADSGHERADQDFDL